MIFGAFPLAQAAGAVLAHTHRLTGLVLRKGLVLDDAALAALQIAGHETVIAARLDPGEVMEDAAALRVANALLAEGLELGPATTGRVNLLARVAGVLRVRASVIDAVNRVDEAVTVATLPDWSAVSPGDMVATIKVIPFAVAAATLDGATRQAASGAFTLAPFRKLRAGLVLSELPGLKDSVIAGTIEAMAARVEGIGGTLLPPLRVPHTREAIAAALTRLLADGAEMLLIAGASATVDRRDVGPAAVVAAGGEVQHFGMPVDPGNLICVCRIGAVPALVLPGCARSPKTNGIDWVMQRLAAGLPVGEADIMAMGVGGLLKDGARPLPRARPRRKGTTPPQVAAIVLAAGHSARSAPRHKLLVRDLDGVFMITRTVDAVLASRARPVVVVLGHRAEEMRAALGARPVRPVIAADFATGLAASLRTGLAALPPETEAALVCLGDMPLVDAAVIDRLIAAWDRDEGRLVVQPTHHGRPGNPVLFDRALFPRLLDLQGDVGARALLAAMADEVVAVEVGTASVLTDFDTPERLAVWAGEGGALHHALVSLAEAGDAAADA